MTVLHILDHSLPVISGYSTRSDNIVRFQAAHGVRPVILTSPRHGAVSSSRELLNGVPYYRTPPAIGRVGRSPYIAELRLMHRTARRIAEVARAERATILHAHSPVLNGLPALWVGRRLRLPVVYEARAFWEDAAVDHGVTREGSLRYRVSRALETMLFRRADRVVTIAQAMRNEIIERGVASDRVSVVPNGVDIDRFRPVARNVGLAHRIGLNGEPVLGFVGSFYRYEGLHFLLQALPGLRARMPGLRLVLVGGGEEDANLRAQAAAFGSAVIFTGQVPYETVPDFYSLIDVFLCPRRRMRLTELVTPLKPLEAMAMGRAILASDVGGLAELIVHDVTGVIFRAENASAFITEAVRIASDAALRARLGTAARQHVERERTWHGLAARYARLYQELGALGRANDAGQNLQERT